MIVEEAGVEPVAAARPSAQGRRPLGSAMQPSPCYGYIGAGGQAEIQKEKKKKVIGEQFTVGCWQIKIKILYACRFLMVRRTKAIKKLQALLRRGACSRMKRAERANWSQKIIFAWVMFAKQSWPIRACPVAVGNVRFQARRRRWHQR